MEREQAEHLAHGVHLIVVQSADGSLVVGDSHHYADTPDPFAIARVDELILEEFAAATGLEPPPALERWMGTYASAQGAMFIDAPSPEVRLVMVTSGSGASTGFAIGEEVVEQLIGPGGGACGIVGKGAGRSAGAEGRENAGSGGSGTSGRGSGEAP